MSANVLARERTSIFYHASHNWTSGWQRVSRRAKFEENLEWRKDFTQVKHSSEKESFSVYQFSFF